MRYTLLVTGSAYGTQNSSSALLFARTLLKLEHKLESIFFYRDGVLNGNRFIFPATDEVDIVRGWQQLYEENGVILNICIAAALRRGVINSQEALHLNFNDSNLQFGFKLTGLRTLAKAILNCDRLVQF
ncbi:sulfurtransferase complex subunit TusD [Pantoea sp. Aalb]|uniref:sulfurtransferase complex subunit TusD n=1 Tax=Pantoea sp. Aalb TaxID=2576762 RepID=UPI001328DA9F|nr:sulfurtransferase complex subunit TusD [Pantoea sp. Aalb]MXP67872.1 sulfurtransferase complex subunit TusD [Pantoea sp. Aalb]